MTSSLAQRERSHDERPHSRAPQATTTQVRTADPEEVKKRIAAFGPLDPRALRVTRKELLPILFRMVREDSKGKKHDVAVEFLFCLLSDLGGADTAITTVVRREMRELRIPLREALIMYLAEALNVSRAEITNLSNMAVTPREHDLVYSRIRSMKNRKTKVVPISKTTAAK